jgi:tetratricopeptide (TPR) repeat protein
MVPAGVAVATWLGRKRSPFFVGGLWVMVLSLLPVLGLVPFDFQHYSTVTDHYLYVAMLGPAIVAAFLLDRVRRPAALAIGCVLLGVLSVGSVTQTFFWHDTRALFSHAVDVNPRSLPGNTRMGIYATEEAQQQLAAGQPTVAQSRLDEAVGYYLRALQTAPDDFMANRRLADAYWLGGRLDLAAERLRKALGVEPDSADTHSALGALLMKQGDLDGAAVEFEAALKIDPAFGAARRNLAIARQAQRQP